jgi:hypothetical protein
MVPKAPLDHKTYIPTRFIRLDHISILFLGGVAKYPFLGFTPPPLYRALVAPHK